MTTRRERLEAKAEKRRDWAQSRSTKASAAFERADLREEKSGIPFGQPVLVGHHSERRHRNVLARADRAMAQSCEHANMAKHHAQAADGIERQLETSIFSDDPDAIEALTAKLAKLESERESIKEFNKKCRKGDVEAIAKAAEVCRHTADNPRKGLPAYKLRNLGGEITRCKKRILEVKARQAQAAKAEAAGGVHISRHALGSDEWVQVTFAEKPERLIINELKAAGFRWGGGHWGGYGSKLPASVSDLTPPASDLPGQTGGA